MLDGILDWPPILSALVFVTATIALALAAYGAMRRVFGEHGDGERRELAGSVIFRVSALHGLILALVFAQEISNLGAADEAAAREAMLVADTYFDLARFDPEESLPIRKSLAEYVQTVSSDEWAELARSRTLDETAWAHWRNAYEATLDLQAATPRQEVLHDLILHNVREISSLRRTREAAALEGVENMFLVAALVGLVLTAASYFTFAPNRLNIFLLSVFAAYTGLVIYFILAFSNPFHAPGRVEPIVFERLLDGEIGDLARAP